jgi:hypothetical protein
MTDKTKTPERYKDTARNLALNKAVARLDEVINQHDPEMDLPITHGVWNVLDLLLLEMENRQQDAALAMVAAAYEAAGQYHDRYADSYRAISRQDCAAHEEHARRIRALTPDDARATLECLLIEESYKLEMMI